MAKTNNSFLGPTLLTAIAAIIAVEYSSGVYDSWDFVVGIAVILVVLKSFWKANPDWVSQLLGAFSASLAICMILAFVIIPHPPSLLVETSEGPLGLDEDLKLLTVLFGTGILWLAGYSMKKCFTSDI